MEEERREEIESMITALTSYWMKHPELRLGQIIHNINYAVTGKSDSFYTEDPLLYKELMKKVMLDNEN